MSQTGIFQTAELKETCDEQQSRAEGIAGARRHWRNQRSRQQTLLR